MKNVLLIFILLISVSNSFAQDKIKVRFKKGTVYVDKVEWAKYEQAAGKYFITTLAGDEFVSINSLSFGTGKYFKNTGEEIMHRYCSVNFFNTDLMEFEVDDNLYGVIKLMVKRKVLDNDTFLKENAIDFKNRYESNVSEKVFLTK